MRHPLPFQGIRVIDNIFLQAIQERFPPELLPIHRQDVADELPHTHPLLCFYFLRHRARTARNDPSAMDDPAGDSHLCIAGSVQQLLAEDDDVRTG